MVSCARDLATARGPVADTRQVHSRLELGDRKRQTASILVWARVTQGDHLLAPHPVRDTQPAEVQNAWRLSTYALCARYNSGQARHHDLELRRVLYLFAAEVAARIDHGATTELGSVGIGPVAL